MDNSIHHILHDVYAWAEQDSSIRAVALVGSYARGDAHDRSDVDLVILCQTPDAHDAFVRHHAWVAQFGTYTALEVEDWGAVQSVRVFYDTCEVEFGFGHVSWANVHPIDSGTLEVVLGGIEPVYDPDDLIEQLIER